MKSSALHVFFRLALPGLAAAFAGSACLGAEPEKEEAVPLEESIRWLQGESRRIIRASERKMRDDTKADGAQATSIARYFKTHYADIVGQGQIRHIAVGQYWEIGRAREEYQNGARNSGQGPGDRGRLPRSEGGGRLRAVPGHRPRLRRPQSDRFREN